LAWPVFKDGDVIDRKPATDFNDLYRLRGGGAKGAEAVEVELGQAVPAFRLDFHDGALYERADDGESIWPIAPNILEAIEFGKMLPRPQWCLEPVLQVGETGTMFGLPGDGKTMCGLMFGYAVAGGCSIPGIEWEAPEPRKVLYVDFEMRWVDIESRLLNAIHPALRRTGERGALTNLHILNCDLNRGGDGKPLALPDLATDEGRDYIERILDRDGAELLVLDNLSFAFKQGRSLLEDTTWASFKSWVTKLRHRPCSVWMLAHTPKTGGSAFGSIMQTVGIDISFEVTKWKDYIDTPLSGFFAQISIDKCRGLARARIPAHFRIGIAVAKKRELAVVIYEPGAQQTKQEKDEQRRAQILDMAHDGKSDKEIGVALGVDRSTAYRNRKKAEEKGDLK
jgi:RecA-family ATPase